MTIPQGMNEKLRALAITRASITEEPDLIATMLAEHPPSEELARHLAGISAGILEVSMGREQALATIDRFLRLALAEDLTQAHARTRAREDEA